MSIFKGSFRKSSQQSNKDYSEEGASGEAADMDINMKNFETEIMKALWHTFHMLDVNKSGVVAISQLKVITSNVGMKLGVSKAEELLNQDGVASMDFMAYFDVVKAKLIASENRTTTKDATNTMSCLNNVIKTCFKFCNFERKHKSASFSTDHCLMLWRLFNFLSETDDTGDTSLPIQLDPQEAALILREFIDATGQRNKEHIIADYVKNSEHVLLDFTDLLDLFEKDFVVGLSMKDISLGLNQLYDTYILNILAKGMMWKRGHAHKSWKERWLVLTPKRLKYYVSSKEKVQKGIIEFDKECTVEVPPDRPTNKPNRFILHTTKKPYDMSAHDLKTKNEWVSAIQVAFANVGKDTNIQKEAARARCCARKRVRHLATEEARRRLEEAALLEKRQHELDEEKKKRLEDEELLRTRLGELEAERKKREEAEAMWLEEQKLREAEQQRLRELEEIKRELERLLSEERQAKKDEEIVRSLQAKLLEEEFEKREELERLQQQQEAMLRAEREQKAVLEDDRKEQERLLAQAKHRLDELEAERLAAAEKMKEASDKLIRAEKDREIMEEKVKLWKTPVGLARPIQPKPNPFVTHRGLGAFCKRDFVDGDEQPDGDSVSQSHDDNNKSEHSEKQDGDHDHAGGQSLSSPTNENINIVTDVEGDEKTSEINQKAQDSDIVVDQKPTTDASIDTVVDGVEDNAECNNGKSDSDMRLTSEGVGTTDTRMDKLHIADSSDVPECDLQVE